MRWPLFLLLLIPMVLAHKHHKSHHEHDYSRKIAPGDPPKTSQEMMSVYSQVFLNFLSKKHRSDWDRLLQLTKEDAYIETCMAPTYSLDHRQFEKWLMFLGNYYSQVSELQTLMKIDESGSATFELQYSTTTKKGVKGTDKWSISVSSDKKKGHFMVDTMFMISDCKNIPKYPPLEPAVHEEAFLAGLRSKLLSDLFLQGSIHYKEAYDGMYDFVGESANITACDVGVLNNKQFVDYWYKRYGKVTTYKGHMYNAVKLQDGSHHIDLAFTFEGESTNSFFRDSYTIIVKKVMNNKVSFFENLHDWSVTKIHQICTVNLTPMSKYDETYTKKALFARRYEQLYTPAVRWDTVEAFLGMFISNGFYGNHCHNRFNSLADLQAWVVKTRLEYWVPSPQGSDVYEYQGDTVGFWIDYMMMAKNNNATEVWRHHFKGIKTQGIFGWQFNHFAASCV